MEANKPLSIGNWLSESFFSPVCMNQPELLLEESITSNHGSQQATQQPQLLSRWSCNHTWASAWYAFTASPTQAGLDPRNLRRGIGSLFDPCVNALGRRPYCPSRMEASYCTFGFGAIITKSQCTQTQSAKQVHITFVNAHYMCE